MRVQADAAFAVGLEYVVEGGSRRRQCGLALWRLRICVGLGGVEVDLSAFEAAFEPGEFRVAHGLLGVALFARGRGGRSRARIAGSVRGAFELRITLEVTRRGIDKARPGLFEVGAGHHAKLLLLVRVLAGSRAAQLFEALIQFDIAPRLHRAGELGVVGVLLEKLVEVRARLGHAVFGLGRVERLGDRRAVAARELEIQCLGQLGRHAPRGLLLTKVLNGHFAVAAVLGRAEKLEHRFRAGGTGGEPGP